MRNLDRQAWDRMEALFAEALTMAPERRSAFLDEACASDPALRTELESLLASYDEASDYFDSLAEEVLPPVLQSVASGSASSPSRVGQRIGAYRIVEAVGGGGMGVVYRAHDTQLDRNVALKFLPPPLSVHPAATERFIREARAASALDHPNICTIYEIGEAPDGQLFIAMAYYAGETLKAKIARGPLPVNEAIDYATQIADGLACAHGAGVIHRDVKPANILITEAGIAKIVDFGLAKGAEAGLTRTGAVMGTVAYMSPEQARGDPVDARTDLWALGVVLYEMMTGRRPFEAGNEHATLHAILHQPLVPMSRYRDGVPAALHAVVERCLEKAPSARYPAAEALRAALSQAATSGSVEASPRQPVSLRQSAAGARRVAAVLVALIVLGGALWAIPPARSSLLEAVGFKAPGEEIGPSATRAERSLVVLPCSDAPNPLQPEQALCTGLMAVVADQLAPLRERLGVWVVPAGEVRERGATTPTEAHRWYDADRVLTGTVRRTAGQTRVQLHLLDGASSERIATSRMELRAANAIVLHDSTVRQVAALLGAEALPASVDGPAPPRTASPKAYTAYVQGRGHLWWHATPRHLDAAIEAFARALAEDSAYAAAHARLGESYWRRYTAVSDTQWAVRAASHIQRALALDDRLAAAHTVQGWMHRGAGQHEAAIEAFRRARADHPERPDLHRHLANAYEAAGQFEAAESTYNTIAYRWPDYWLAFNDLGAFFMRQGQFEAAVTQFRQAVSAAPLHFRPRNNLAALYHYLGRLDEAQEMYKRLIDLEPNAGAYSNLGTVYFEKGRYADAIQMYNQALGLAPDVHSYWGNLAVAHYWAGARELAKTYYRKAVERAEVQRRSPPQSPILLAQLGGYYAMLDQPARARSLTAQATAMAPNRVEVAFAAATTYEHLGQRTQALHWIEQAVTGGYPVVRLEHDPTLRQLRADKRYRALLQRHREPL